MRRMHINVVRYNQDMVLRKYYKRKVWKLVVLDVQGT